MRQVCLTGEEPYERTASLRDVIADCAAQHWIARLERVKDRTLGHLTLDADLELTVDLG
jgi:hypothetical protein